jgi:hypothetical protein
MTRWFAVTVLLAAAAAPVRAQSRYAEYRVDGIAGNGAALQAGAGLTVPLGIYTRLGLDGAAGTTWHDGTPRGSGRFDAIARYTFDPLRETPVALSLGGGVSVPVESGNRRVRPYVTVVVDIEGRRGKQWTPAVQFGFGGGARLGFVLRASPVRWR